MPNENVAEQLEGVRKLKMQTQAVFDACTVAEDALSTLEQVRGETNSLAVQITTLQDAKTVLGKEVAYLTTARDELSATVTTLTRDIESRKANAAYEIQQAVDQFRTSIEAEKAQLAADFKAWKRSNGQERAALEGQKKQLETDISDLQTKLDALRAEVLGKKVQ